MSHKRCRVLVVAALSCGLVAVGFNHERSEIAVSRVLSSGENAREGVGWHTATERQLWLERSRELTNLWLSRRQRDITAEVMPYLRSPFPPLRRRATRALGHLETPQAQAPLEAMLSRYTRLQAKSAPEQANIVPFPTLQLAVGRLRSRDLSGRRKLEAIASSVGLTFSDVVLLSHKINSGGISRNSGSEVLNEMLDVLYVMGKRGENIQAIGNQLSLDPGQRVFVQCSSLSDTQEIALILNYLCHLKVVKYAGDDKLMNHLVDLGPPASDMVIRRLAAMQHSRQQYPFRNGYVNLFIVAADFHDRRALPMLNQFEVDSDPAMRYYARYARRAIETKSAFANLP